MRFALLSALAFAGFAQIQTPALAGEGEEAAADMIACTAINKSKHRLKCFERALPGLRAAFPEAEVLAAARAEDALQAVAKEAKEEFGLTAAETRKNDPAFESDFGVEDVPRDALLEYDEEGDINSIESAVVEVGRNLRGKLIIILENGQVWRQIDADTSRTYIPKKLDGVTAKVKRASLGSYVLRVSSARNTFKVRRVK